MERIILWSLLIIGITLLFSSLRKPPIKNWILILQRNFFSTVAFGTIEVTSTTGCNAEPQMTQIAQIKAGSISSIRRIGVIRG